MELTSLTSRVNGTDNMSSYYRKTKNPRTGKYEMASWLDNYFGARRYGVKFEDGTVYNPEEVKMKTKD